MRYSVLIVADRSNPGLLSYLTSGLYYRGISPEIFQGRTAGPSTLEIRLEFDCEEAVLVGLRENWEMSLRVQAVITTPKLPMEGLLLPNEYTAPATAMD